VSGEAVGEEWTITAPDARMSRPMPVGGKVLTAGQAQALGDLARDVAGRGERPQDIEWAIDRAGRLWLLQARPMTALPESVSWTAPGPGLWMRNFRLGEWLPEATWLLPVLEDGYLDGMHQTVGLRVPFRYALVNGWYYNAAPIPSPKLLSRVLWQGRGRAVKILYNALFRVSRNPAAAIAPYCPIWTTNGERSICPPTGSSSPMRRSRPQQLPLIGWRSWSTSSAGRPESTCGIWRSSAGRHGKWRPA